MLTILFLIVTLFGGCFNSRCTSGEGRCGVKNGPIVQAEIDSSFLAFIDSVPIVELGGFMLSSGVDFQHVNIESNFIPKEAALIGRLLPLFDHEFIIYSYPADIRIPVLEIYDSKGEKVNERELFDYGYCHMSVGSHHVARLSKDLMEIYRETYCSTAFSSRGLDTIVLKELIPH